VTPFLVADSIARSYGRNRVLTAASLRAVPCEVRALFGRNGAGKSTLLQIACGWAKPDSGTIRLAGAVHAAASLPRLARLGVFYWPDADLLSSRFTVRQQLELLRRTFAGLPVGQAAEMTRITELLDERPVTLSGGERRRAELAAVLVRRPACLLADEPYRGIDPRDVDLMTDHLRALAAAGAAIVATGHEAPTLLAAADHVTWCTNGTTHELGPPAVAITNDQFRREYLGR
jgi:ABC-type multidrug transport system ATPase subunit